jgi:hypothetical protein
MNGDGMIMTDGNRSARRKTISIAPFTTANPTWKGVGSNPTSTVRGRQLTARLRHGFVQIQSEIRERREKKKRNSHYKFILRALCQGGLIY